VSTRVTNRFADLVLSACESDAVVVEKFFRVNNFIDPPVRLMHPAFISRVAAANLRRKQGDHAALAVAAAR
jgi:hypothetical protein